MVSEFSEDDAYSEGERVQNATSKVFCISWRSFIPPIQFCRRELNYLRPPDELWPYNLEADRIKIYKEFYL